MLERKKNTIKFWVFATACTQYTLNTLKGQKPTLYWKQTTQKVPLSGCRSPGFGIPGHRFL